MVYVMQVCRQLSSRTRMELKFQPGPAAVKLVHLIGFITKTFDRNLLVTVLLWYFVCGSDSAIDLILVVLIFAKIKLLDSNLY